MSLIFEICVGDVGFAAFETDTRGSEASAFCQEKELIDVAPIRNQQQLNAVAEELDERDFDERDFIVGMERAPGTSERNPRTFFFTDTRDLNDPDLDDFIHVDRGDEPWLENRPNSVNDECVRLIDGNFDDINCNFRRNVLCLFSCAVGGPPDPIGPPDVDTDAPSPSDPPGNNNSEAGLDYMIYGGAIAGFAVLMSLIILVVLRGRKKKLRRRRGSSAIREIKVHDLLELDHKKKTEKSSPKSKSPPGAMPSMKGKNTTLNDFYRTSRDSNSPTQARPDSIYMNQVKKQPRVKSIFRPSSKYLKKAEVEKQTRGSKKKLADLDY